MDFKSTVLNWFSWPHCIYVSCIIFEISWSCNKKSKYSRPFNTGTVLHFKNSIFAIQYVLLWCTKGQLLRQVYSLSLRSLANILDWDVFIYFRSSARYNTLYGRHFSAATQTIFKFLSKTVLKRFFSET